jgi:hypothetical protein
MNVDIVNNIIYKHITFQYEFIRIMGYTEITKFDIVDLKIYILRSTYLSFLCSSEYKKIKHGIFAYLWDK